MNSSFVFRTCHVEKNVLVPVLSFLNFIFDIFYRSPSCQQHHAALMTFWEARGSLNVQLDPNFFRNVVINRDLDSLIYRLDVFSCIKYVCCVFCLRCGCDYNPKR